MNLKYSIIVLVLAVFDGITCDCGCLKCSKHLQVISPPSCPYKIIVKGAPYPEGYRQAYAPHYDYSLNAASLMNQPCQPVFAYKYKLQAPLPSPGKPLAPPMTGLIAKPDRIVIHQTPTTCPVYTADDGACDDSPATNTPTCTSIFQPGMYQPAPMPLQAMKLIPLRPKMRPVLEPIGTDFYNAFYDCRN
ncbi:uncharacterized protein LOC123008987 [Tribolium madens]|uniref:uncharacterized protein LOC123008987 n=1 Tax=Tribolium madens TaxID=41895 RepID=UPI001CF7449E|nr:uncharacterized protein LOC123008987 [Tribolium madens]